jgi:UDP-N-acetylglucosamine 2-epimerase (non-hydrolysing)
MAIVLGDINSTMAGALAAAKLCIPIAHIEAGLRSFDRSMPEEINRMVTDSISNYLFTTCEEANQNLLHEGHPEEKIFFVGNVMIDSLYSVKEISDKSKIMVRLDLTDDTDTVKPYGVLTLHRPSNVDDKKALTDIFEALAVVAKDLPIIFPVHPRTRKQIQTFGLEHYCNMVSDSDHKITNTRTAALGQITCINPLGIVDFFKLLSRARLVMTDSGGITEETTVLKVPCLTMRDNTERSITVTEGTNMLVGNKKQPIIDGAKEQLARDFSAIQSPRHWDGKASERIVDQLLKIKNELRQKVS